MPRFLDSKQTSPKGLHGVFLATLPGIAVTVLLVAEGFAGTAATLPISRTTAPAASNQRLRVTYDAYILGPGDALQVELLDIPELSGLFTIGPDGTMYLPRLRALYVEGLTVEELRFFLTQQFKAYVKNPQIYVKPVSFRPVRVYVGGEITRPGYYTISGSQPLSDALAITQGSRPEALRTQVTALGDAQAARLRLYRSSSDDVATVQGFQSQTAQLPTLFDALRAAQGVTPFSNLAEVQVVRKQPLSAGGGRARATVDFLRLLSNGDESVNIRLFDGDVVNVSRSPQVLRDQLLAASRSNLSPDFIQVYVSGRVKEPGPQSLPQGATLNQAIASAGGAKLLRGQVEFLRFSPDGATDRRLISLNPGAKAGDFKNPVLMNGDVVRINDSLFSATVGVLNEVTGPAVGIYSVYSLFKPR